MIRINTRSGYCIILNCSTRVMQWQSCMYLMRPKGGSKGTQGKPKEPKGTQKEKVEGARRNCEYGRAETVRMGAPRL